MEYRACRSARGDTGRGKASLDPSATESATVAATASAAESLSASANRIGRRRVSIPIRPCGTGRSCRYCCSRWRRRARPAQVARSATSCSQRPSTRSHALHERFVCVTKATASRARARLMKSQAGARTSSENDRCRPINSKSSRLNVNTVAPIRRALRAMRMSFNSCC